MFNQKEYIQSKQWEQNGQLVIPSSTTKICNCCGKSKYTIEFIDLDNWDEFVDGKMPVCTDCYKAKNGSKRSKVEECLNTYTTVQICSTCEKELKLHYFKYDKTRNGIQKVCALCTIELFKTIKFTE
jgi:hypothetical protein